MTSNFNKGHEDPSSVTQQLIEQMIQRDAHGRKKYGVTLDRPDLTHSQWLQHMAEELMDGAGYALAAKRTHDQAVRTDMRALVDVAFRNVHPVFGSDEFRSGVHALRNAILDAIEAHHAP